MDNQHRKITGYRELSATEIDLMNRIKAKGLELLMLQAELMGMLGQQAAEKSGASGKSQEAADELDRFLAAEPQRWCSIGKTDVQAGIMALVRAVAQPAV